MAGAARWTHSKAVFTYSVDGTVVTPFSHELPTGSALSSNVGAASFSVAPGESLLVCTAGIPFNSGNKLADNLASTTSFPDASNKFHVSSHVALLGSDTANQLRINYSSGFESRARFIYFDRANFTTWSALSVQQGGPIYTTPVFAGLQSAAGTGTDAAMGTVNITALLNYNMFEQGPIHIIKWASGANPPLALVKTAMEWMWYVWNTRNRFVLYTPLVNY